MRRVIYYFIGFMLSGISALTDPPQDLRAGCPQKHVSEGETLQCECRVRGSDSLRTDFFLSWPRHSNNSRLTVMNVTRSDNGTVFTCLLTSGGQSRTANYTLQVAFGPDDQHTKIDGPVSFTTDGTRYLRLKCVATDVYPPPHYQWEGVTCHNNDSKKGVCLARPKPPWDDKKYLKCSARSNVSNFTGNTVYRWNLTYPPSKHPEILGYNPGQVLRKGDKIHCRVSGGKPLVKEVKFSCSSDPPHQDQEDTTDYWSVQSSVIININGTTNHSLVCVCSAVWEPSEDLYRKNSSVTVFVSNDEQDGATYFEKFKLQVAVAVPSVLLTAIAVGIVATILLKKKEKRRGSITNNSESCEQTSERCKACSDYEDIDEPGHQEECRGDTIQQNSSDNSHGILDGKMKFSKTEITSKRSKLRDYFHSSSNKPVSGTESSFNVVTNQVDKAQFSGEIDEGIYTEIEIAGQGKNILHSHPSFLTTRKGMEDTTCSLPGTQVCRMLDDYDNAICPRAHFLSPALDIPETKKEEWELYDTFQRR